MTSVVNTLTTDVSTLPEAGAGGQTSPLSGGRPFAVWPSSYGLDSGRVNGVGLPASRASSPCPQQAGGDLIVVMPKSRRPLFGRVEGFSPRKSASPHGKGSRSLDSTEQRPMMFPSLSLGSRQGGKRHFGPRLGLAWVLRLRRSYGLCSPAGRGFGHGEHVIDPVVIVAWDADGLFHGRPNVRRDDGGRNTPQGYPFVGQAVPCRQTHRPLAQETERPRQAGVPL